MLPLYLISLRYYFIGMPHRGKTIVLSGKTPREGVPALRTFQVENAVVVQMSNLANRANITDLEFTWGILLFYLNLAFTFKHEDERQVLRFCHFNVRQRIRCSYAEMVTNSRIHLNPGGGKAFGGPHQGQQLLRMMFGRGKRFCSVYRLRSGSSRNVV